MFAFMFSMIVPMWGNMTNLPAEEASYSPKGLLIKENKIKATLVDGLLRGVGFVSV